MNNKKHNGFIALTLVISISSLLMAFTYIESIESAHYFDQTVLKKYRLMNYYSAQSCIDQAILRISQDYFFIVDSPLRIEDFDCYIDSIKRDGDISLIKTHGDYMNIKADREARVKIYDNKVEILNPI
jgi:hypothetical protein